MKRSEVPKKGQDLAQEEAEVGRRVRAMGRDCHNS